MLLSHPCAGTGVVVIVCCVAILTRDEDVYSYPQLSEDPCHAISERSTPTTPPSLRILWVIISLHSGSIKRTTRTIELDHRYEWWSKRLTESIRLSIVLERKAAAWSLDAAREFLFTGVE